MPKYNFKNFGEVVSSIILEGKILSVNSDEDTCDVEVIFPEIYGGKTKTLSKVPIFYHCEDNANLRDNGAVEGGSYAFTEDDKVMVMYNTQEEEKTKVIGFIGERKECDCDYLIMLTNKDGVRYLYKVDDEAEQSGLSLVRVLSPEDRFDFIRCRDSIVIFTLNKYYSISTGEEHARNTFSWHYENFFAVEEFILSSITATTYYLDNIGNDITRWAYLGGDEYYPFCILRIEGQVYLPYKQIVYPKNPCYHHWTGFEGVFITRSKDEEEIERIKNLSPSISYKPIAYSVSTVNVDAYINMDGVQYSTNEIRDDSYIRVYGKDYLIATACSRCYIPPFRDPRTYYYFMLYAWRVIFPYTSWYFHGTSYYSDFYRECCGGFLLDFYYAVRTAGGVLIIICFLVENKPNNYKKKFKILKFKDDTLVQTTEMDIPEDMEWPPYIIFGAARIL